MDKQIYEAIEMSIEELGRKFLETPFIFINEGDVKCYLYSLLLRNEIMNKPFKDIKGLHKTIRLHTEIEYINKNKNDRPDIVILNPNYVYIYKDKKDEKYYYEDSTESTDDEDDVPIEIKYKWDIGRRSEINNIKSDLKKMKDLNVNSYMLFLTLNGELDEQIIKDEIQLQNRQVLYYVNAAYDSKEKSRIIRVTNYDGKLRIDNV